jgi:hypothetical protein
MEKDRDIIFRLQNRTYTRVGVLEFQDFDVGIANHVSECRNH